MYCSKKHNTFQTVHQNCVLFTETQQFPDGISDMFAVHRQRTFSVCTSQLYTEHRNAIYGHFSEICRSPETQQFPNGISEMCTVYRKHNISLCTSEMCSEHRNTTISRRYIRNLYSVRQRTISVYISEMCTEHKNTISRRYIRNVY